MSTKTLQQKVCSLTAEVEATNSHIRQLHAILDLMSAYLDIELPLSFSMKGLPIILPKREGVKYEEAVKVYLSKIG